MKNIHLVFFFVLVFQATHSSAESKQPISFDPSKIEVGTMIKFPVNNLPIMVVHRKNSDVVKLINRYSSRSVQMESCLGCNPILRSINRSYFVAWGYQPKSGCELIYVSSEADDWDGHAIKGVGGFVDKCSGSEYDLSGRKIFGTDTSPSELPIPKHHFENGNLIIEKPSAE